MCGRFVASSPVSALAEQFLVEEVRPETEEREASYNVAPTDDVCAVAVGRDGSRQLGLFRWGLVPSWAKDTAIGSRMINLRAETVSEKPSFRRTLQRRRCIIPADGFYEWKSMGKGRKKQPFFVRPRGGGVLALAGLWAVWRDPEDQDGQWLRTCTIITTEPNDVLAPIHDRMPAVLPEESWPTWLDPSVDDLDVLTPLLAPYPSDRIELFPVTTDVNTVANNGPHLIEPLEGHEPV